MTLMTEDFKKTLFLMKTILLMIMRALELTICSSLKKLQIVFPIMKRFVTEKLYVHVDIAIIINHAGLQ